MNILHLNTYDWEGGAAKAAYRLHMGLEQQGVKSQMLVAKKTSTNKNTFQLNPHIPDFYNLIRAKLDAIQLLFYPNRKKTIFSPAILPSSVLSHKVLSNTDIIHLHWLTAGYVNVEALGAQKRPLLWTLHDMWAFTGGCHYDEGCGKYIQSCGACPHLGSNRENDLSRSVWDRKKRAWQSLNMTIVAPSRWLASSARKSSLFSKHRIEVIPYGLDTDIFMPQEKKRARKSLNLPLNSRFILFGAINATNDERKGFNYLKAMLQALAHENYSQSIELLVFGASKVAAPPLAGINVHFIGQLRDETQLSILYSAADLFVLPSIQDNLPNTVLESLACGTPVVAFDVGGMPDMVDHEVNGYLARAFDEKDLAHGVKWIMEDQSRYLELSKAARKKALNEYSLEVQAKRYLDIYEEVMLSKKAEDDLSN